ncbi:MAG: PAS domain S-box protein [Desulfarculaceae bacterium]|nr:PAS domain S-box protein [Desulfarculaceae bacterium]MCF8048045.1 PAS domain S-box protein [Desulfarculaceae bacterium]MCF8064898.1 PAS domain S-box protein [Desulfarculaceae bacterium]MCF8097681.1 PAS domain S-box protein [Desulfarculaceae bacterium]MCF8123711.1 PAS domain S-box protein [Desulfarculaceae bacterium]
MVRLLSKKWLAVYGAGMALVLMMAVLVGAYYRSQAALRESHLESFHQELTLRATTVSFFYNELYGDLRQMAGSKRVESYFGSKALGMSLRYGLGASLAQVGRMLERETNGKLLGPNPVWLRLALVEPGGKVLVERRSLELRGEQARRLILPPLDKLGGSPVMLSGGEGAQVAMGAPCFYSGRVVGYVVGWVNATALCAGFIRQKDAPGMGDTVLAVKLEGGLQTVGCSGPVARKMLPAMLGRSLGQGHLLPTIPASSGKNGRWLGMGEPVKGTPFVIYSFSPASMWLGEVSPWQLSLALALAALVLMGGLGLLVWSNYRNAVLAARLDQEELGRQALKESYDQLSREMATRARAEMALRASEERFRGVFDHTSLGIAITDRKGHMIQVNPAWGGMLGYTPQQIEGLVVSDITHPDDREVSAELFGRLVSGDLDNYRLEKRYLRSSGEVVWVELVVSAVRGPSGELDKAVGVANDISERKKALEALKNSEEKFNTAFQSSPDSVLINQLEGRIFLEVNDSFLTASGYERREVLGSSGEQLGLWADPADRERFWRELEQKGECLGQSASWVAKDGREIPMVISGRRVIVDGQAAAVSIARDVTEARQAQQALELSQQRYRSLVENVPYGIFITEHPSGTMLFANQTAVEMMGYKGGEVLGLNVWDMMTSQDQNRARQRVGARAAGQRLSTDHEIYTCIKKDGAKFRCEVTASMVSFQGKQALQGIVRDVTEREQLERQLQHAQKMEALGTLAGGVAHEFNNILMTFRGYIQILQMRPDLDPEVSQALEKMNQSTRRAGGLTQKMLTFSRMEAGEKVPVQVNRVIKDMESLLRQTFPPGIHIHLDLAQDLPVVLANPNQIEQVLINLALNARDAMNEAGNLSLTTSLAGLDQEFCNANPWAKPGSYVMVQVADDGPGMPSEVLERIFEPFFTTKEPGRGTGLGLSVAYSLIKSHGGGILAVNRPQGGGAFRIFLPVSEGVSLDSSRDFSREATPKGGGQRLLVVDDEEAVRDICRQALETFGYQVTLASDGAQGVESFRQAKEKGEPFDLVLMDLAMPKMDGRAAGKAIWELDPQARIIIATGHGGDRYQVADLYPQAQGVLQKPFDLSTLLKEVNRILSA